MTKIWSLCIRGSWTAHFELLGALDGVKQKVAAQVDKTSCSFFFSFWWNYPEKKVGEQQQQQLSSFWQKHLKKKLPLTKKIKTEMCKSIYPGTHLTSVTTCLLIYICAPNSYRQTHHTNQHTLSLYRGADKLLLSIQPVVSLHHSGHRRGEVVFENHLTCAVASSINLK